mmetsp:Transcript_29338/g.94617  ORF Transcript_29338/g.94617 Transcript_29338/m.94617 type:complete len:211 (-) Transcript_29338:1553-2185(-)|eukprot:scaffold21972_cov123-Isochrysis_galbana.AAC.2
MAASQRAARPGGASPARTAPKSRRLDCPQTHPTSRRPLRHRSLRPTGPRSAHPPLASGSQRSGLAAGAARWHLGMESPGESVGAVRGGSRPCGRTGVSKAWAPPAATIKGRGRNGRGQPAAAARSVAVGVTVGTGMAATAADSGWAAASAAAGAAPALAHAQTVVGWHGAHHSTRIHTRRARARRHSARLARRRRRARSTRYCRLCLPSD